MAAFSTQGEACEYAKRFGKHDPYNTQQVDWGTVQRLRSNPNAILSIYLPDRSRGVRPPSFFCAARLSDVPPPPPFPFPAGSRTNRKTPPGTGAPGRVGFSAFGITVSLWPLNA